jgi:hypothetical protein
MESPGENSVADTFASVRHGVSGDLPVAPSEPVAQFR